MPRTEHTKVSVTFDLPIDIETGHHGLWYVMSPLMRGLFAVGTTKEEAISHVTTELDRLVWAVTHRPDAL